MKKNIIFIVLAIASTCLAVDFRTAILDNGMRISLNDVEISHTQSLIFSKDETWVVGICYVGCWYQSIVKVGGGYTKIKGTPYLVKLDARTINIKNHKKEFELRSNNNEEGDIMFSIWQVLMIVLISLVVLKCGHYVTTRFLFKIIKNKIRWIAKEWDDCEK